MSPGVGDVKERPILFSSPMVRAILDGRKTQTRRVVKPQPEHVWGYGVPNSDLEYFCAHVRYPGQHQPDPWVRCPYGAPPNRGKSGDRLWVRETWAPMSPDAERRPIEECGIEYHADTFAARPGGWDNDPDSPDALRWRPSIHMPRQYSRLTLEITAVRVERLRDITEEDAKAEGVARGWYERDTLDGPEAVPTDYRGGFRAAWNEMHSKRGYGWDTNPWVWVVEFRQAQP